ncbi:MFS transporter [Xenorhabdus khoisanae]|nr:MFS transporter [Xenorhabdus khoisanae]
MIKYVGVGANELDTYLDYAILSIIAVYILQSKPYEIGILGACFAFPFLLSSYLFGRIFDKVSILKWRAFLFIINIIVMPLICLSSTMVTLYFVAIIKTTSRCGIYISNTKLNINDDESKKFYEIYGYMINFSRVVIPLVIIFIYHTVGTWGVIAISMLLNLVALLSTLSDDKEDYLYTDTKGSAVSAEYSFYQIVKNNTDLFNLVVAYTLANLAFFLSNDMLSIFFRHLGQSENSVGYIISLLGIGGFLGTKLAAVLVNDLRAKFILLISVFINTTAFTCFGYLNPETTSIYIFYIDILLVGISSGLTFFSIRYGVRNIVGYQHMGKTTGNIQMLSSIFAILMPIVGGFIANNFSINFTFKITSFILGMTFVYFILFKDKMHKGNKLYEKSE